jgi:hypothetical protein
MTSCLAAGGYQVAYWHQLSREDADVVLTTPIRAAGRDD